MNHRQRTFALLNYEPYDRLPTVHFGFWPETIERWAKEGHISTEQERTWANGNAVNEEIGASLGFDYYWPRVDSLPTDLLPPFERQVLEQLPDGSRKVSTEQGVIVIEHDGGLGIPSEVGYRFKGRQEWEELFLPRLQFTPERAADYDRLAKKQAEADPDLPHGLFCGSLYGIIRDMLGMINLAYLQHDDYALYCEIINTVGDLCFQCTQYVLEHGGRYDFAHFWEDICFRSGPLVNPRVFRSLVGPHYGRITTLLHEHDIQIVSLDCDGKIDALLPIWLEYGVNTMFPIEVGVWAASLKPWREQYGRELRGIGGVEKKVFAADYAAVDAEIERLKPLVDLGGYLPCPDHRLPPESIWENVQYYCDRLRQEF